jgi:hypothetical protein
VAILAFAGSLAACGSSTKSSSTTSQTAPAASTTTTTPHKSKPRTKAKKRTPSKHATSTTKTTATSHTTTASTSTTTSHSTTSPTPTTSTSTTHAYTRPIHATLVGENHTPKVNQNWTYSITVTDATGQKLSGTETTQYVFNGSVVGTEKPENVPVKNGYYQDTIQFPADALGVPLTLQATVQTSIGSIDLSWAIKVQK